MNKRSWLFVFGFLASLALHVACVFPFAMSSWLRSSDEAEPLVIELTGDVGDMQAEEQTKQVTKGGEPQNGNQAEKPAQEVQQQQEVPDAPPQETAEIVKETPPSSTQQSSPSTTTGESLDTVTGAQTDQNAQTIKATQKEQDRIRTYVGKLGKRIQSELPNERRRASVTISFSIQGDGRLQADSLTVVQSSGQPALDTSALNAVRASVPFEAPPKPMTIKMEVDFNRKR